MPSRGLSPYGVVDIDRRVLRRSFGVDQNRGDADPVEGFQRLVVRAKAEADETVHRRAADGALQRAVEGRDQEQGEVVLFDELAETLHELPQEPVGGYRAEALRAEKADGSASAHRQSARGAGRPGAEGGRAP